MPGTSNNGITHHGCSPGKMGPITPLATSSSRWMSSQASSLGCRWGSFAWMGTALVEVLDGCGILGPRPTQYLFGMAASLSSHSSKACKKECHVASPMCPQTGTKKVPKTCEVPDSGGSSLLLGLSASPSHAEPCLCYLQFFLHLFKPPTLVNLILAVGFAHPAGCIQLWQLVACTHKPFTCMAEAKGEVPF